MEYAVAILVAALAAAVSYATLNKSVTDRIPVLKQKDPNANYTSRELSKTCMIIAMACIFAMGLVCTLIIMRTCSDAIGICRMLLAFLCMAGAGCVDYRERRIPNFFSGVMAIGGSALLIAGILSGIRGAVAHVTTSIVSAVCCVLFLTIASALTKQGIGAGDIKLIGALALSAGLFGVLGTLFFGVTICSIAAVFVLLMKKQDRHGSLPFGPFLFIGFVITILTGNF